MMTKEKLPEGVNYYEQGISGDESVPYEDWRAYEKAVDEGREEAPTHVDMKKRPGYEFNVDKALDSIDLTFNGYSPSVDAIEFFNIIRLVLGEEPEVPNSLMHYFLVDLIFGNIKRENYPYSKEIRDKIRINERKIAIIASRGTAKALTLDSSVITPTGSSTIKDVKVGDVVIDRDGKKCNVIAKSPIFNKPVYKITLADGRTIHTSGDHDNIVWKRSRSLDKGVNRCKNSRPAGFKEVVMTTEEILKSGVCTNRTVTEKNPKGREYKYFIPVMGTASDSLPEYGDLDYGFDAYTTGIILGDGSTDDSGYTRITAARKDILEYERNIPYEFGMMTKKIVDGEETNNYMFGLLQQSKRIKKWIGTDRSYTKKIPKNLKYGAAYHRLEVLKGLMDTDGTAYEKGYCSFTSVSKQLASDVEYIVRSLGGIAFTTKSKTNSPFGVAYSVRIKINRVIFKLKRKVQRQVVRMKDYRVGIESIERVEDVPTQCIAVDSPTKSFLTDGHTVTHNSTIVTAYLPIYLAIKGEMPNFGKVMFAVGFGDSQKAGAKIQANTIRDFCADSVFCKDYFEKMRFTDEECEFIRKGQGRLKDRAFMYKVKGAAGGSIRGIRYRTERPSLIFFDDIVKNEADANSKIIMDKLHSIIYADAEKATGLKGKIIAINTPFNKKDPIYSALESGIWTPICIPMCEHIDLNTTKETFKGAWEAYHSYQKVMESYIDSYYGGTLREFNQELMLRISSEAERMVKDDMIQWISYETIKPTIENFTILITTDLTATEEAKKKMDYSGVFVWAIGAKDDAFLIDISLKKRGITEQYDAIFSMVRKWSIGGRILEVGVELDGQQQLNLFALKKMMIEKNIWFRFAHQKGAAPGKEGINSKNAGGNKFERFKYMMPTFKKKKFWICEELKEKEDTEELLEELRRITFSGINSLHDDGIDCVSQLGLIDYIPGSDEAVSVEDNKQSIVNGFANVWGDNDEEEYTKAGSTIF